MPSAERSDRALTKSSQKRGSISGEKVKKSSKKKRKQISKKLKVKANVEEKDAEILEVEGLCFNKEIDDSDSSVNKTPLFPLLSSSDVTVGSVQTTTVLSTTDSLSTKSSSTKQFDKPPSPSNETEKNNDIDKISSKLSNLSVKTRKTKSVNSGTVSKKDNSKSTNKTNSENKSGKFIVMPNIIETPKSGPVINESIRWENELDDQDSEKERIHIYKINRRKRYLASAQVKGLGWVKQYGVNGFPLNEDNSLSDSRKDLTSLRDFSPVSAIRNSHSHATLNDKMIY